MNSFDKLLTEISWMYDKGYPDFSIKKDREALYDYLLSIGFPHSDVIELSERFIKEETFRARKKDSGKIVVFKSKENRDKAIKSGDYEEIDDDKKDSDSKLGGSDFDRDSSEEPKVEPEDEPKDEIDAKLKQQEERFAEKDLNPNGVPNKEPENVPWDDEKPKGSRSTPKQAVIKALDNVVELSKSNNLMTEQEKKDFASAIDKVKNDKVDELSDSERQVLKDFLAVKDQEGTSEVGNRSVQFYLADVRRQDWRFGVTSVGGGEASRQARQRTKKGYGTNEEGAHYNQLKKLGEALGLKVASPTNSRTTSKMMAPTAINKKRKEEKIKVGRKDGKVVSANIAGQTHTKRPVPKISDVEKALIEKGMDPDEAKRKARSAVIGIKRYNDQIDLLAETAEAEGGKLEVVDYGDTSTTEGRRNAINQCLQDVATTLQTSLESTIPPHPPLGREHYELIEKIKNIKNPLEDSKWDNLSFEEQQKRVEQFNNEMGEILVEMNALGDMMTSRAEVAEAITYMHRLSQGFTAILPASETFKVTDVYAIKDPGNTNDPEKLAESIQQVLVSIEVSGGESVKYDAGARSSSAGKVTLTVYKNKGTRKSINDLLDTYDKIYNGDDYPPGDAVIKELDKVKDATKAQVVNDGIMTEEEYDKIYEAGMKTGEKSFDALLKKNKATLETAGFTEDDLRRVKESFMKHCAHGKVMAEINNRDTEYNKFNNVAHKIAGFKQDKETKEVTNKGKYKTIEADGINTISGMDFSCDQGFKIADPPKKKISPENTNPSAIIALDAQTGKKVR